MDFLTVHEVSQILKAHTNTVYKMCREGSLSAVKIGKEWRVDRKRLAKFMEGAAIPEKKDTFQGLVQLALQHGHLLGIFSDEKDIIDFELTYLMTAMKTGHKLIKTCWWQHPDDVRRHMASVGMPVEQMESQGALLILNMNDIFLASGVQGAANAWRQAVNDALDQGYKGVVGAGSKHFDCCKSHHSLLSFENALSKIFRDLPLMGVCTYLLDMEVSGAFSRLVDLLLVHDSFFIQTEDTEILAKVSYSNVHPSKRPLIPAHSMPFVELNGRRM